ncbi:MAG: SPFH/Band 7/PHB domain protein [Propionibacterium sp.]|nr:SPFH/Band 7/PHB domain protein [Propionibacterium sp.]
MSLKIIRQQQVAIVERLGKLRTVLEPGPHLIVPLFDQVRYVLDMREEVVPFPPQGVITEDNLMVSIDSVIYFQIVDPKRAAYEAQDYRAAIEQLTMTTLRNIIGGLDLELTLTSREEINQRLRAVLDDATGKWGIKVNRVELRSIEPPATIRDAMEKGARAERDKRAQILLAEGQRQSQILQAGGDRESSILRAQGEREAEVLRAQAERQSQMLRAEGEAQAITTVFGAIHAGQPDQALLAYQYMQMLPELAKGDANKVWIIPSELNDALKGLGTAVGEGSEDVRRYVSEAAKHFSAPEKIDVHAEIEHQAEKDRAQSDKTVQKAIDEAQALDNLAGQPKRQASSSRGLPPRPAAIGQGPEEQGDAELSVQPHPQPEADTEPQQDQPLQP